MNLYVHGPRLLQTPYAASPTTRRRCRPWIGQWRARGLGNAEIAASMVLSEATVRSHIGSILAKLKLKNRIQIVAIAYKNKKA
ncbi:helix-turn-helix transcriptional regulator [Arthrobacter sp. OY3WO11]|uniref:response regulator transcription factor n=1 Tax=Arthrobacter sp. OY3WO11 TaxID=1835723 RepID=UPI002571100B|nr:helix-turn-helix transcriptional regulator [Arthrobacter sp. OY3WO11]